MKLQELDDDALIHIFGFVPAHSVLSLRQTCKRLERVSRLRFVWQNVYSNDILPSGFPFPHGRLATASAPELERLVLHSLRLGAFWSMPSRPPARSLEFQASTGTGLSHIAFLPGHGGKYLLTVYKGIWSMITCWDIGAIPSPETLSKHKPPRRVADWSPQRTIFSGFVVNSDSSSEATIAVAVQHGGSQSIELLSVEDRGGIESSFRSVCNIATAFRPIALNGDLIALSDDGSETVIMNWRANTFALLKGSERVVDARFKYNRCLKVVFASNSILVVRARSIELFPEPVLTAANGAYTTYEPTGVHSFGWIDGVAVNTRSVRRTTNHHTAGRDALSIVLRAESDDPWAADVHTLEQFVLAPNPAFDPAAPFPDSSPQDTPPPAPSAPYIFPPVRAEHTAPAVRGFLRCRTIALGRAGTALWVRPRAARDAHLTGLDVHASAAQTADAPFDAELRVSGPGEAPGQGDDAGARGAETLCAAVFEGPLRAGQAVEEAEREDGGARATLRARTLWVQGKEGCSWSAFDYDEEVGRVALGSSDGNVTVLDLV